MRLRLDFVEMNYFAVNDNLLVGIVVLFLFIAFNKTVFVIILCI